MPFLSITRLFLKLTSHYTLFVTRTVAEKFIIHPKQVVQWTRQMGRRLEYLSCLDNVLQTTRYRPRRCHEIKIFYFLFFFCPKLFASVNNKINASILFTDLGCRNRARADGVRVHGATLIIRTILSCQYFRQFLKSH